MPKKPSPKSTAIALDDFGLPSSAELQRAGVISGAISKIIADDETVAAFHHKMVRNGICCRYELALAIALDENAFANFAKDPRIKALHRPPKGRSGTLQCLFQATYSDPKKASKYYKRIEHLWQKRCSAAEVLAFLEKNGVSKPSTKASSPSGKTGSGNTACKSVEANKTLKAAAGGGGDNRRISASTMIEGDTPCGTFYFWSGKIAVGRFYNLRVKILDDDGEMTNFDLLEVSPSSAC